MTTYCKIEDGLVVDRALFDGDMPEGWGERGGVWQRSEIAQIGWGFVDGVFVELAPEIPPAPLLRTYRSTFIERMSNAEAEVLEATMAAADAKLRLMYQSVEYFVSDDPLFAVLHWTVAVALGTEGVPNFQRADALLAPG